MAGTNKTAEKTGVAGLRTKRAATKRTRRAAPKPTGKSIVQLRQFKAAKPTEERPLPEPIATFTI